MKREKAIIKTEVLLYLLCHENS